MWQTLIETGKNLREISNAVGIIIGVVAIAGIIIYGIIYFVMWQKGGGHNA